MSKKHLWQRMDSYNRCHFYLKNHGPIYRGCNNEPLLFEKPEQAKKSEQFIGVDPEEEWQTFTDIVSKICLLPVSG